MSHFTPEPYTHTEHRSETLRLDATFLVMGQCNTKWILDTYRAVWPGYIGLAFRSSCWILWIWTRSSRFLKGNAVGEISGFVWMSSILWGFIHRWLLDFTVISGPIDCPEMVVNFQSTPSKKKKKNRRPKMGVRNSWANIPFKERLFFLELLSLSNCEVTYR